MSFEEILRRLESDDPGLTNLWVKLCAVGVGAESYTPDDCIVEIENVRGAEVLGNYLGRCTHITILNISVEEGLDADIVYQFLAGLQSNRSISELALLDSDDIPHDFFRMLTPFIASNLSLVKLDVNCEMDADQYHSLALALREDKSLKEYHIGGLVTGGQYDHEESIIDNIETLKMHPQLEKLHFSSFAFGRTACLALSNLLQQSAAGMIHLSLCNNDIDDTGVEALVDGLAHCRRLQSFQLARNPSITARGWRAIASLLEDPNFRPQWINLMGNSIDNEIATVFANALAHNNTLEQLYLDSGGITSEGWDAFAKALCDTSSVNGTFLSNHTLHRVTYSPGEQPDDIQSLSQLNGLRDKKRVAFTKILLHHDDFDMQPLFEWDLKVLPCVVRWLERAAAYGIDTENEAGRRKLAAIFQFVRGMPELAVEGITGANKKSPNVGEKRPYLATCE